MEIDILALPGLKALHVAKNQHGDYQFIAETTSPPFSCLECGSSVIGFGKKEQLFMEFPTHGKRTGIVVVRKRYRCKECLKTFLEPLGDMDEKRMATRRLVEHIEKQSSFKRMLVSISDDIGLMHDRFILLKRYRDLDAHELLVLESWINNFKDLGAAYQLKEQIELRNRHQNAGQKDRRRRLLNSLRLTCKASGGSSALH